MFLMSEVETWKLKLSNAQKAISGYLSSHDGHHLLSDGSDLGGLGVGRGLVYRWHNGPVGFVGFLSSVYGSASKAQFLTVHGYELL